MDRYNRHYRLPNFDKSHQERLLNSRIVVVGAGGLGIPVLQYLVAAGIGQITIIDDDVVDLSNLQRQVLFKEKDIDQSKAKIATNRLSQLNSDVVLLSKELRIDKSNINELIPSSIDIIIDASDNFATRYLLNDHSERLNIPLIYGAIHRYEGQMCVFNFKGSASYRDLYAQAPDEGTVENCDINGVLGPVAGLIGNLMANECIKIITGIGKVQCDELILIQLDDLHFTKMRIPRSSSGIDLNKEKKKVYHSIDAKDLRSAIENKEEIFLLDVRQVHEFMGNGIQGSINIPADQILGRLDEIPLDKEVVVICNIGQSSMNVIRYLQNEMKYINLINLHGGLHAYYQLQ